MKINFTLFGAKLTGGTFVAIETANRLAQRGHEISVTTIGDPSDLDWFRKMRTVHFKEIFAPLSGKMWYRAIRKSLRGTKFFPMPEVEIRDLLSVMPDCDVNVATAAPTAFAVHRSGKGKGWYYAQHYDSLFGKDIGANLIHDESYFLPLEKLAVSSWLRETVEKKLHVSMRGVITPGIDETIFYPRPETRGAKKRIISLGRRVDWKGFAELQEAMRKLLAKRDDIEWIVYSSHDTPEPTADAPFTVAYSPFGKTLAELYAQCDIAVNPSWHEGFSQPALEAMACGCAVVTTAIGTEDFMEPGKNCILVQPKHPDEIEQALTRLLDDDKLRERMAAAGLATAKNFYWDRIVDRWEKMLLS
jgi:glycosyltransferase involved in cell wall biosynthesis